MESQTPEQNRPGFCYVLALAAVINGEPGATLRYSRLEALQLAVGRLHCGPWHEPAQLMGYIARQPNSECHVRHDASSLPNFSASSSAISAFRSQFAISTR